MFDAAFLKGETWGFPGLPVEHIETHAAHVFLAGDRAFKIKKAVKLPYLDFTNRDDRRRVLETELEINHSFAPGLYREVSEVKGEPVLVMRRFASNALLSWKLSHGGIDAPLARRLAETIASAHVAAPRRDVPGPGIMMGLAAQLSRAFVDAPDIFPPGDTLEFHALLEDHLRRLKPLLNERAEQGLVRRCHGDAHCGNIIVEADGKPVLFDAIEFSEKIATIDVLYDLAFLLMDLWQHEERDAANVVLNRYLNLRRVEEDLSGLALLPLFLSVRAGVRALVTADLAHELPLSHSMKERGQALDNFRASIAFLKPAAPRLVCIGGLSGSGKSTVAAAIAASIGRAPGAIHVRTDIERKALAGIGEMKRLPFDSYSRESSVAVYDACFNRSEKALKAGQSVVLDAVFAHEVERNLAADLAMRCNAGFQGVWLDAPAEALKTRVTSRTEDASDATAQVVDLQLRYGLGRIDWTRTDASGPAAGVIAAVREKLRSRA